MKTKTSHRAAKPAGGRPRKFQGPCHVITVTLPDDTLRQLEAIRSDRAKAIVQAAATASRQTLGEAPAVELVRVADQSGLIVIGPSRYLREIPFLNLSEVAPCRYILSLRSGTSPDSLEIALEDLLENIPPHEEGELRLLKELHRHIRTLRRSDRVSKAEILLVRME